MGTKDLAVRRLPGIITSILIFCVPVFSVTAAAQTVTSVVPSSGTGITQTFTFQYSDTSGAASLQWVQTIINSSLSYNNGCATLYDPAHKQVYLLDYAASSWGTPMTLGASGVLQNSQCSLSAGDSSASSSGNSLNVSLAFTFKSGFTGSKTIYASAEDASGANSGWKNVGSWNSSAGTGPTVVSVTPNSSSGASQTFTFQYSDSKGSASLQWVETIINSSLSYTNACATLYDPAHKLIYLLNDAGSSWGTPMTIGASGVLQNSQCSLSVGNSSASSSGNTLNVSLAITFKSAFTGTKNIYASAQDVGGANSGWASLGSWSSSSQTGASVVSVTPNSGSGSSQSFTFQYSDAGGAASLQWVETIINSSLSYTNSCATLYDPAHKQIYLLNDAGSSWGTPMTLGTSGVLQNSQCSLSAGDSSASSSGNTLNVSLSFTFKSAFTGSKTTYASAEDVSGTNSGWTTLGSWTVTSSAPAAAAINHVIFMMQENRSFDNYFGMLNPYRAAKGWNVGDDGKTYLVDGLDHSAAQIVNYNDEGTGYLPFKLGTSCINDLTSAWLESYGDVTRYNFSTTRSADMNGFVHIAEGFAKYNGLSDTAGKRTMGYYDQTILNYYYYMASQFAVSDRWFSPISSKTVPNRIATMTGGTTQGLVKDPSSDDHVGQLSIPTIFQELDKAGVSWKIYYSDVESNGTPTTSFTYFSYANQYVGDRNHLAPLSQFYTDVQNGTLPAFAYIEPGYTDGTDEHPDVDIVRGQQRVANLINALMNSVSWKDSVFFFAYDEGGPFDHVPPVSGQTNKFTDPSLGITTDISSIAVNPDSYYPCPIVSGSYHCDLANYGSYADPGYNSTDAAAQEGFAAQLGFRVPNLVISPFTRRHYVSHIPMDHTAIIKFVENRFIGSSAHLTARDAAQPNLLDFFDFTNAPWMQPPAPPTPATATCDPTNLNPAP